MNVSMLTDRSISSLGDDVLLNIFTLLAPKDITSVRRTCKYFSCVSRARYLWHRVLAQDVVKRRLPLPRYRKSQDKLGSREHELLARQALRAEAAPRDPIVKRIDQARQSISWVRIVQGQWLLVASRHVSTKKSTLSVYAVTAVQQGRSEPLLCTELPGPVSSGEVEVQEDQLVVALCFQAPERMVTVMGLRREGNAMAFKELTRFVGLSHVKALRGELIGCAVQGSGASPCLANWKTGEVVSLPTLEKDARCLGMAVRSGVCAVVTPDTVQMYALSARGDATLLQVLQLAHVVENVSISKEAETLPFEPASGDAQDCFLLTVTNKTGVFVYRVQRKGDSFSAEVVAEREEASDAASRPSKPAYPCFGGSSSRVSWIYPPSSLFDRQSRLVTAQILPSEDSASMAKLSVLSECKAADLPSLYAMPVMDFDDGVGLLAIGNGFGHLALCSFNGILPQDYHTCLQPIPIPAA